MHTLRTMLKFLFFGELNESMQNIFRTEVPPHSLDEIINFIYNKRNSLISGLLSDPSLMSYVKSHFHITTISPVRLEFLKRELKQQRDSPLDLVHYSSLIKELKIQWRENLPDDHPMFEQELMSIFKKYLSI